MRTGLFPFAPRGLFALGLPIGATPRAWDFLPPSKPGDPRPSGARRLGGGPAEGSHDRLPVRVYAGAASLQGAYETAGCVGLRSHMELGGFLVREWM